MRIRRSFEQEPEPIQMAPLIDIVFLTLVFFMATTVYGVLESEVDITLPKAETSKTMSRSQGEIIINLKRDGSIVVNNRPVSLQELQDVLVRVSQYFPGSAVIIRGDKDAMLGNAIQVLDCCRKAGIQNISFATIKDLKRTETVKPPDTDEKAGSQ
ncbi:MAG: biopolymer transporter ExbD [Candidatus Hydrogenedentes bacterium]|nr:biopolymer transporter ExbD [Candidatus Hydrogenedentota bacterium]